MSLFRSMRSLRVIALVLSMTVSLSACSDDSDENNDPGKADASDVVGEDTSSDVIDAADSQGELTAGEYEAARSELVFELWCKRLYECPEQASLTIRYIGEGASPRERCPELLSQGLFLGRNSKSVEAGRMTYDEARARQCLSDIRALVESDACPAEIDSTACQDVITPTVGSGDACSRTSECEDNRFCNTTISEDSCEGECTIPEPEGASCDPTVSGMCGDLTCSSEDFVEGTCVQSASSGVGETCGNSAQCEDGLICNRSDDVCREPVFAEEGDPCEGSEIICSVDTVCSLTDSEPPEYRCQPVVELGESCTSTRRCQADAFCNSNDVCELRAAEGDSCSPPDMICQNALECVDGECVDAFPSCYD